MNKIEFHKKKMNLLEARVFLLGLELGINSINLDVDEESDYLDWKKYKEEKNEEANVILGKRKLEKLSKKQYLIEELNSQIVYTKNSKKREYCEKHEHKEMKESAKVMYYTGGAIVKVLCSRCNTIYNRKPTPRELENAKKTVYNPFQG
jgi:hypothetical protein